MKTICFFRCLALCNGCNMKNLETDTVLLPTIPRHRVGVKEVPWSQNKPTGQIRKIV